MNEAEWMACTDPTSMLAFVSDRAGANRLRWFALACACRVEHLLGAGGAVADFAEESVPRARAALEWMEQATEAEGLPEPHAPRPEIRNPNAWLDNWAFQIPNVSAADHALKAVYYATRERLFEDYEFVWPRGSPMGAALEARRAVACKAAGRAPRNAGPPWHRAWMAAHDAEAIVQAGLLRCILGNLFHPPPVLDPGWIVWQNGTIRKLAQAIYRDYAFDRLPILADALEEAGCTDAEILAHCRQPSEHARGCWVVDLLLGRQ
jgi:hypothetical protein